MTSHLTEFPRFNDFPTEIRLLIWERVEQPTRLIGQVPCSNCFSLLVNRNLPERGGISSRQRCRQNTHPGWDLKYIVHPRTSLIFPPLHACRESRAVWLPRFWKPPKYWAADHAPRYQYRFFVPFISYERDIFTIFDSWSANGTLEAAPWEEELLRTEVDPFGGLDRRRIHHIGVCENLERFWLSFIGADFDALPNLKSLSVICLGPVPKTQEFRHPGRLLQMTAAQSQDFECHIRDLEVPDFGTIQFQNHIFFNKWRPRHQFFMPDPVMQPFDNFFQFWKAWLWHITQRGALSVLVSERPQWWDFEIYVFGLDSEDDFPREICPLTQIEGCGPGGHSREEMLFWEPPFELKCKFLCEEGWLEILGHLAVFKSASASATDKELEDFKNYVMTNYDNFWNSYDFNDS